MSSITLTLTGNLSQLEAEYFPSIDLSDGDYVCGLIDFQTFNSIPNVDETNDLFYFGHESLKRGDLNDKKSDNGGGGTDDVDENADNEVSINIQPLNSNDIEDSIEESANYNQNITSQSNGEEVLVQKSKRSISSRPYKKKQPLSLKFQLDRMK